MEKRHVKEEHATYRPPQGYGLEKPRGHGHLVGGMGCRLMEQSDHGKDPTSWGTLPGMKGRLFFNEFWEMQGIFSSHKTSIDLRIAWCFLI